MRVDLFALDTKIRLLNRYGNDSIGIYLDVSERGS